MSNENDDLSLESLKNPDNIKDIEELEKELVSITKEEYNTKYNNI